MKKIKLKSLRKSLFCRLKLLRRVGNSTGSGGYGNYSHSHRVKVYNFNPSMKSIDYLSKEIIKDIDGHDIPYFLDVLVEKITGYWTGNNVVDIDYYIMAYSDAKKFFEQEDYDTHAEDDVYSE